MEGDKDLIQRCREGGKWGLWVPLFVGMSYTMQLGVEGL